MQKKFSNQILIALKASSIDHFRLEQVERLPHRIEKHGSNQRPHRNGLRVQRKRRRIVPTNTPSKKKFKPETKRIKHKLTLQEQDENEQSKKLTTKKPNQKIARIFFLPTLSQS